MKRVRTKHAPKSAAQPKREPACGYRILRWHQEGNRMVIDKLVVTHASGHVGDR